MGEREERLAVNFGHSLMAMRFPGAVCHMSGEDKPASAYVCPKCGSEAVYKYGRAWTGKQRFHCLICGLQFAEGTQRARVAERPVCPECGSAMHVYKKEKNYVRYRCGSYPDCKTFLKINTGEKEEN